MKATVVVPEGYRLLDIGEILIKGDLWFHRKGWQPVLNPGDKASKYSFYIRKKEGKPE